ncbi:MAG: hypothetical protein JETT_3418 [Candidatus Jettenia ecosi]|uniref:Uncharacterized protein n=1 Tax=Candidatus Jettenia ecosi TaxID=2494326 RepID=A0A533Q6T6_9BACT|nr:MAG: hypothetical protein JETT_3418 [Candidatus Jettenia ecosi]
MLHGKKLKVKGFKFLRIEMVECKMKVDRYHLIIVKYI